MLPLLGRLPVVVSFRKLIKSDHDQTDPTDEEKMKKRKQKRTDVIRSFTLRKKTNTIRVSSEEDVSKINPSYYNKMKMYNTKEKEKITITITIYREQAVIIVPLVLCGTI